MKYKFALVTIIFCLVGSVLGNEAVPAQFVGTWRRDYLVYGPGELKEAHQKFLMMIHPDGRVVWPKYHGLSPHAPMKIWITKEGRMFEKVVGKKKPQFIGTVSRKGNQLTMTFTPVPMMPESAYTFVSKPVDSPAVPPKK